jgi:uncharacterized repeat protein (TIGR03847 family)
MPESTFELNPVTHITAGYVGQPGKRVFYLQARREAEMVTFLIEKQQLEALATGIEQFLNEVKEKFPTLAESAGDFRPQDMELQKPLDPAFRVGQMGLAYDEHQDLVVLVAQEVTVEGRVAEEGASARLFATRSQLQALSRHSLEIIKQGRPICGNCGQPIDPSGHFCPKRNGHNH